MIILKIIFLLILVVTLSNANQFRILTNEEPPTNYLDKNQQVIGITVDIINKLKEKANINANVELITWARAYIIAQKKANILIFTAGKSKERIDLGFHFIGPITTRKQVLFSKVSSDFGISNLRDIKNKKLTIGAMREDWRFKYFKNKGIKVKDVSDHQQNAQKLIMGRIDLWATSNIEAPIILEKANIPQNKIKEAFVYSEAKSYIMISKKTPNKKVKELKKIFFELQKTDFFKNTAKKWSNILNINLKYTREKGFFKE